MRIALFRAVTFAELMLLIASKSFTNPPGIEVKYFALTENGARRYAMLAEGAFGNGPFRIVATSIPDVLVQAEDRVDVDGGIPTVTIRTELLYALSPCELLADTPDA